MPLLSQYGGVDYLPGIGSGLPVGLFDDAEYVDLEQQLAPDFNLLLSSDGIFEVLPGDELADKEAQLRTIMTQCDSSLDGLIKVLKLDGLETVPDDIALLNMCGESYA